MRPLETGENKRTPDTAAIQCNRYFMRVSRCVHVLRMMKINSKKKSFPWHSFSVSVRRKICIAQKMYLILKPVGNLGEGVGPFTIWMIYIFNYVNLIARPLKARCPPTSASTFRVRVFLFASNGFADIDETIKSTEKRLKYRCCTIWSVDVAICNEFHNLLRGLNFELENI